MKKILTIIILLFSFHTVFAETTKLPFLDVKTDDELYSDLSTLYRNHVIKDTNDQMFHPDTLIPRDEFVAIVVGIGCRECINPSTEDFIKYDALPFLDISKLSPYFYCVSIGKDDGITQGYLLNDKGEYTCQNKETYKEIPFCPANNITRIEAATVLLRSAKIWNDELNSKTDKGVTIADVDDKWYGFAKKGLEVGILKKDDKNKIYPNEFINRREFVHMAVKIFGMNFCEVKAGKNTISGDIKIYDKDYKNSCTGIGTEATLDKPEESVYDIVGYTESSGDFNYNWELRNSTTGEVRNHTGKCLNDYDLISNGKWLIKLVIKDKVNSNRTVTAYSQIFVSKGIKNQLKVNINADPILGEAPLSVNFTSIVKGAVGKTEYIWDFGDNIYTDEINPSHIYQNIGVYTVSLKVRDSIGNTGVAELAVEAIKSLDTDKDGILDREDQCPKVHGDIKYGGCPKITEYKKIAIANVCLANKVQANGGVEGLLNCNACPCNVSVNFLSSIRDCDILFPAITSPDKGTIYSRGSVYQVN